jgi:hypothetical protein
VWVSLGNSMRAKQSGPGTHGLSFSSGMLSTRPGYLFAKRIAFVCSYWQSCAMRNARRLALWRASESVNKPSGRSVQL